MDSKGEKAMPAMPALCVEKIKDFLYGDKMYFRMLYRHAVESAAYFCRMVFAEDVNHVHLWRNFLDKIERGDISRDNIRHSNLLRTFLDMGRSPCDSEDDDDSEDSASSYNDKVKIIIDMTDCWCATNDFISFDSCKICNMMFKQ